MSAKKSGCLRNFLAVVFTTIVAPVLANVFAQDVKDWQDNLAQALAGMTAPRADWSRPGAVEAERPTHTAPPALRGAAVAEESAPRPGQATAARQKGEWRWAAGAWGQ